MRFLEIHLIELKKYLNYIDYLKVTLLKKFVNFIFLFFLIKKGLNKREKPAARNFSLPLNC